MTTLHPTTHDVRLVRDEELRAAYDLFGAALLHGPVNDERWERAAGLYAPQRTIGVFDGSGLFGTAMSFPVEVVVPGGAALPTAAVTRVGVRADRTRRGVLTALMRRQLDEAAAAGDVLASLRATEARIYGRFGYGVATRGRTVRIKRNGGSGWRSGAPAGGDVRMLTADEMVPALGAVHERVGLARPGGMTRTRPWWDLGLGGLLQERTLVLAAVHTGADGEDGYLVATVDDSGGWHDRVLVLRDLHATTVEAATALWRFALDVDLVAAVEARLRPLDEPLELLLADPRDCATTAVEDETWLRIVDVPAALAARRFAAAEPVLIAVHDAVRAANGGVYRIADGGAERVGELGGAQTPDLECDVAGLAMAYLGDRAPSELAATGWWRAWSPAATARADAAFGTDRLPWCGTNF
ncbi:GNAT family N-acetyltransferase [Pseudonocardia humida]|uniref:GNAT family N-acetyltransferase n=1 Tax=Pseudonocardia humida TaxID=2800819 RepID=A0ABT0ZZA8_9PSEU|nr:GNAT family N-acetyltransferase [Pseudonocardia humida]MCO1656085.1 GNAT family N-acetyltransferase [Pseudonocardia humida]